MLRKPPERRSDEADKNQLRMAKAEGAAYQKSLAYMAKDVADAGGKKRAGDYIVGYAQERAEGMYALSGDGTLKWSKPDGKNCHLEISVSDAGDKRFIPYLDIKATLTGPDGKTIGPLRIPFVWHPGLYHYGRNITVPGDGKYALKVDIAPPKFMRHDKVNGKRYADAVSVEFKNVPIRTGKE